ncbi:MAG: BatA domain-containing protein, partial [Rhizobiaceae bacterium]|nr:BatA domain-containing protein [Rhizobiaceae bacterium]
MSGLSFAFASPAILGALVLLPVIWWLLRLTPPHPKAEVFPPLRILASILKREETPARSPWWLTLLRMLLAALVIFAIANPMFNPRANTLSTAGPLVLFIDNSWATAADWERRVQTADALIDDAEARSTPVSIAFTADQNNDAVPGAATAARDKLHAATAKPLVPDRVRAAQAVKAALNGTKPGTIAFLSDGVESRDKDDVLSQLAALQPSELRLIEGDGNETMAITGATNAAENMSVTATRLNANAPLRLALSAQDNQGRPIAAGSLNFASGQATATGTIGAPFEMRNDFARISIDKHASAGTTYLLDDGFKRRRVALLSGQAADEFQPILSPLYYIKRALQPYADLVEPKSNEIAKSITELLADNPSVIIMADVGRLPQESYAPLQQWLQNGGTLVRFAGPRLAAAPADDPLVPVTLRQGERTFGGALSWAEPQPLADFPTFGPFAGMPKPTNVLVKRQVLADPTPDLAERTWASLADGTPLVTEKQMQAGRIVLFHVSAEPTWSDLPISGDFVEMLRRIVQLSRSGGVTSKESAAN